MRGRLHRGASWIAVVTGLALAAPASAIAVEVPVTHSLDGSGFGTLRGSIMAAPGDGHTVIIDEGVFPSLTMGEIDVDKDLTIRGQGVNATAVTASDMSRIFNITGAGTDVTIEDMTLTSGRAPSENFGNPGGNGGAVNNLGGHLTLRRVAIRESNAGDGGANGGGDGGAGGGGGGVFSSTGDVDVIDSTIAGNSTGNGGTGIINPGRDGRGGGIEVGGDSDLSVTGSLISGNLAGDRGGGIHSSGDGFTAANSTVYGNNSASGGGIYEDSSGTATLTNVTIAGNTMDGIARENNLHLVILENTLLVQNALALGLFTSNCGPSGGPGFTQGGNSVRFPAESNIDSTPCPASIPLVDVGIGWPPSPNLANNGGPTKTLALPAGAAVDAIPAAQCKTGVDQRGLPRPSGSGCDIGAYEVQQPQSSGAPGSAPPASTPVGSSSKKKCKKKKKRSALASKKKCRKKKR